MIDLPVLLPSSWMKVLLTEFPFLLAGGPKQDLQEQLAAFWDCYEFFQPGHEVFRKNKDDLAYTLPLILHGDEGRYLKKGNFMVCTVECVLGSDPKKKSERKPCDCHLDSALNRYRDLGGGHVGDDALLKSIQVASQQICNDSGNEFLSKFLIFGVSSLLYKKHKELLHQAFDVVSADMTKLFRDGVVINNKTYFAATLGLKGDQKFHHQIGNLSRSYYNVGTKVNHPICSLCLAGTDGVDFEDCTDDPIWLDTMFVSKPWEPENTPSLVKIPFQGGCPEAMFRLDLFHCFKCGMGRDLTGSTLVFLCQHGYFDFGDEGEECNLPARLVRAHSSFAMWCSACGKSPALHSFSKSLLNYQNTRAFAWFNVKGSDNTLIVEWLLFFVKISRRNNSRFPLFENAIVETLESARIVFGVLHHHGLWLNRTCGQRVQHHLSLLIRGYKVVAYQAMSMNFVAFGLKPKLHALDHISKELLKQLKSGSPMILNPMSFSCEANESIIGHVSRIARRVSSRTVGLRIIERIAIRVKGSILKFLKVKTKLRPRRTAKKQHGK